MVKLKKAWLWLWLIVAAPFACVTVFCSFMANGPKVARRWAEHLGLIREPDLDVRMDGPLRNHINRKYVIAKPRKDKP